jgi:hypothetical protein
MQEFAVAAEPTTVKDAAESAPEFSIRQACV